MSSTTRNRRPNPSKDTNGHDDTTEVEKRNSGTVLSRFAGSRAELWDGLEDTGAFLLLLALDIAKMVLRLMKQPIAFILVGYILLVMVSYTASYIASLVVQGLAPVCAMPLMSMIPICSKIPKQPVYVQEPRYPDLVNLQTRFESVMESTGYGINLAMDMKNSEMAVRDLNTLVKLSDIVSKDLLASSLDNFVNSAKDASRHLSKLDSGVGGAVDSILAMDDYAIRSLEAIERNEKEKSVVKSILFPFSSSATRKQLIATFNQAAGVLESNLRRLIETSVATTTILSQLESELMVIHEVVSREEGNTKHKRDEVLADLWTYVGANRAKLANFANHKNLLSQVANYRSAAAVQVGGTLVQLEKLASDLDDLRERVATPLLAEEYSVPLEVHIMTLRKGVDRLTERRRVAKQREEQVLRRVLDGPQYRELSS